jgi:hypothetical protein
MTHGAIATGGGTDHTTGTAALIGKSISDSVEVTTPRGGARSFGIVKVRFR